MSLQRQKKVTVTPNAANAGAAKMGTGDKRKAATAPPAIFRSSTHFVSFVSFSFNVRLRLLLAPRCSADLHGRQWHLDSCPAGDEPPRYKIDLDFQSVELCLRHVFEGSFSA